MNGINMENSKIIYEDTIISVTPEMVAELFAGMCDDDQAKFFNHVAKVATTWSNGGWPMQLQHVTDQSALNDGGRRVMQMIGEYSHWGIVDGEGL